MIRHILSKASGSRTPINLVRNSRENINISFQKLFTVNVFRENINNCKRVAEETKISSGKIIQEKGRYYGRKFYDLQQLLMLSSAKKFKEFVKKFRSTCEIILLGVIGYCLTRTVFNVIGYPAAINGKSMRPTLNPEPCKVPDMDVYGSNVDQSLITDHCWGEAGWTDGEALDNLNIIGPIALQDWVWVNCWRGNQLDISRGDLLIYISPKDPNEVLIKRVIALENDTVHTDGRWTEETGNDERIRIPRGHVWVQGDNLTNTVDSNKYGPVSLGLVIGVASHVIWPLGRLERLDNQLGLLIHSDTVVQRSDRDNCREL